MIPTQRTAEPGSGAYTLWVPSLGSECGIAEYTSHLMEGAALLGEAGLHDQDTHYTAGARGPQAAARPARIWALRRRRTVGVFP
jgi:hypothetical protein